MKQHAKFILCVDDDSDDLYLLKEAILSTDADMEIKQLYNGAEALKYLRNAKDAHDLPCVVVLDINMPVMDGKETLRRIKADPALSHVQVVVLTTSSAQGDKEYFATMDVMMFTKPMKQEELQQIAGVFMQHCK